MNDVGKIICNVDPAGSINNWALVAFIETRWTELVNNLESKQADWDDSDWKDNESEVNSDWNKSPPSSPPSSRSSSNHSPTQPSPLSNNNISNHFKTLGITTTSCLNEVKFAYRNFVLMFHPDKCNNEKPIAEEEGNTKFKYVFNAYKSLIESNFLL